MIEGKRKRKKKVSESERERDRDKERESLTKHRRDNLFWVFFSLLCPSLNSDSRPFLCSGTQFTTSDSRELLCWTCYCEWKHQALSQPLPQFDFSLLFFFSFNLSWSHSQHWLWTWSMVHRSLRVLKELQVIPTKPLASVFFVQKRERDWERREERERERQRQRELAGLTWPELIQED